MKKLLHLTLFSLLTCCKAPPPDVSPCLMQGPGLQAIATTCNNGMKVMGDPACTVDVRSIIGHCSPVLPTTAKKKVDIEVWQLDKMTGFSNPDWGTIQQWIVQHEQ